MELLVLLALSFVGLYVLIGSVIRHLRPVPKVESVPDIPDISDVLENIATCIEALNSRIDIVNDQLTGIQKNLDEMLKRTDAGGSGAPG